MPSTSARRGVRAASRPAAWPAPSRFLTTAWPELVRTAPAAGAARARGGAAAARATAPRADVLRARLALHGLTPPRELEAFLAPLGGKAAPPRLHDLVPGTRAPRPARAANHAVALLEAAQQYRPLWDELFAGAFEIGRTRGGDVWSVALDPLADGAAVYLYGQDTDDLEGPAADGIGPLVAAHALVAARDSGHLTAAAAARAARRLAGRIDPAFLGGALAVTPLAPASANAPFFHFRARWLVTALGTPAPSARRLRDGFLRAANTPLDAALLAKRAHFVATFPPTAFYTGLATYFAGDDALTRDVAAIAAGSPIRLVRDLGRLLVELLDGERTALGVVPDVPALRARIVRLRLWA